jgi:hypothetical protein
MTLCFVFAVTLSHCSLGLLLATDPQPVPRSNDRAQTPGKKTRLIVFNTEYTVANFQSSFVLALCSKMGNSTGIPVEDSKEDGNQHSRL